MEDFNWKNVNLRQLRKNAAIMYNMLAKIASNQQVWCLKEVKDILENIKKEGSI